MSDVERPSEKTAVDNGPQDIVARLRKTTEEWPTDWDLVSVLSDAAAEIERLREKLIRMGQLPSGDGYMPQVLQDGVWTDLFTMCVDRLMTARVVTTAVRGKRTRIVERLVQDRVVES